MRKRKLTFKLLALIIAIFIPGTVFAIDVTSSPVQENNSQLIQQQEMQNDLVSDTATSTPNDDTTLTEPSAPSVETPVTVPSTPGESTTTTEPSTPDTDVDAPKDNGGTTEEPVVNPGNQGGDNTEVVVPPTTDPSTQTPDTPVTDPVIDPSIPLTPVTTEEAITTDTAITTESGITTDSAITTEGGITTDSAITTEAAIVPQEATIVITHKLYCDVGETVWEEVIKGLNVGDEIDITSYAKPNEEILPVNLGSKVIITESNSKFLIEYRFIKNLQKEEILDNREIEELE